MEVYILSEKFRGYDPYDALLSPLLNLSLIRKAKLMKWACQQILKRIPFQIRPLLRIEKEVNPVTLALFLHAISLKSGEELFASGRNTARRLVTKLMSLRSKGQSGSCWGYNFPWQGRFTGIPAYFPTVVVTGIVTNALFECFSRFGITEAADLIVSSLPFIENDLNKSFEGKLFCWSYSPKDTQKVLNATMQGARICAQAASITGQRDLLETAERTVAYVVGKQHPSGKWPYSINDVRSWADNFHTGYILDHLHEYIRLTENAEYEDVMNRGWEYYRKNFFLESGAPKYYDTSVYPFDSTSSAQALLTLTRFNDMKKATRVAEWALTNLSKGNGEYKYQIYRYHENKLTYMRWSVAWMFLGYAAFADRMLSEQEKTGGWQEDE